MQNNKNDFKFILFFILIQLLAITTLSLNLVNAEGEDVTRPFILPTSIGVKYLDNEVEKTIFGEDLTNVPINSSIVMNIQDENDFNLPNLTSPDSGYIVIKQGETIITGNTEVTVIDLKLKSLTFKPDLPLEPGSTYTVFTGTQLKDATNNPVIPITFKFIVKKSDWNKSTSENINENLKNGNPHGMITSSENYCFNCHGTQKGLELTGENTIEAAATDFCMACHDGTLGSATAVDGANEAFTHGGLTKMGSAQCSDCHDTHLTWSESNPNSLKRKLIFTHHKVPEVPEAPEDLKYPGTAIPILEQSNCVTCHMGDTKRVKELALSTESVYDQAIYVQYNYKKMATTTGQKDDMSLCFSCHNNSGKAINIEQFYTVESGHNILYDPLDEPTKEGYLSCSDCHQTHGSDNMYVLNASLGHENPTNITVTTKFETENLSNDRQNQKDFCISCHNGTTKLYGSTPKLFNNLILGHANDDPSLCSVCHGGDSKSFVEAVHAPTRLSSP